ncbi:T9SS type A sorting domain-containing protein [Neolewinella aurantiaca]|uniref:T9SS type A sorting domain-containing protein n=1 Tax=Neolewinella aurantiaca TaxID=2602767 RepID=A0A5C7FAT0_9BACT|nr:FG-GAP-like repeat-containing protein [Neolewinella aurantiaca]TXF87927.1 T9SS type A sorting domain-containing protein [Neolewinella aurantiaca]
MTKFLTVILIGVLAATSALPAQNFSEVSAAAGIDGQATDPVLMSGGVVWFDYNNDRYPDLLFLNGLQPTRLFRNNWNGSFTDVSESTGVLSITGTMGAVSADFNNDGFADLFITTMDGTPNVLLENTGGNTFRNVSVTAGITDVAYSASAATGDYDGDGDLDIYVSNYMAGTVPADGGQLNFMYRNDGNFSFTEVATALQLDDPGCGLGVTFSDLNDDGRPDLYLANDFGYAIEPNEYFQNDFPSFSRKADRNGTAATINAMGIAKGDYDNDGDLDLYVTNIRENPLFTNTGGGLFFNFSSYFAGVALPELTSWGTSFTDFDLDGHLDLIVANGQVAELNNEPEAQRYYHNNGDGSFADQSAPSGVGAVVKMARGLAVADYDLDGYPDVAINSVQTGSGGNETTAGLLHNEGGETGKWLALETPGNTLKLTLFAGEESWLREVDGGSGYLSHSAVPVHFGAPASSAPIDSVVVTFTSQTAQTYTGIAWNQLTGIRSDGSWYLIDHTSRTECSPEAAEPELRYNWQTNTSDQEILLIERTEKLPFTVLEEQIVELTSGEVYRDLARTQDAVLVDTIAGQGLCPVLQPIRIRVYEAADQPIVYPNPLRSDELQLQLPTGEGDLQVKLLTSSGRIVYKDQLLVSADQRSITLPLPGISRGVYILRLDFAGKLTHHKVVRP